MSALPRRLRLYLLAVSVVGPLAAIGVAVAGGARIGHDRLLAAALLTALAALADRYPLHLTHKTSINVGTTAYMAMILVLPAGAPGALALLAMVVGHAARRAAPIEGCFNAGQGALYVTAGAVSYAAVQALSGPGATGGLLVALAAAAAMHIANTGLVALAAALQLESNPLRVWWTNLAEDLPHQAALSLLGGVAALVAADQPLLLPALALPAVLVRVAVRNYVRLREDTAEALAALVDIVELRDPYTAGHSRRVAALARDLALRLGLTAEEADAIESAGRVHDVGKVALDPAILGKPGKLTEVEWALMREHPGHGATVVARFNAFQDGDPLVRHHHESWDGSGYPDGLAGEAIPLGARILAVADTFDALTSDRPYRAGMSVDNALRILQQGAGTQWDAHIVAAMVARCRESVPAQAAPALTLEPARA